MIDSRIEDRHGILERAAEGEHVGTAQLVRRSGGGGRGGATSRGRSGAS